MDINLFDFELQPGQELKKQKEYVEKETIITVIIPFYNDKEYIEKSINCVLNQTFPYYEILIIDDGSKDEESLKILEKIEKIDKRIKIFHKENGGLAETRDYGASKASSDSKYLFFLDSDDLITETYFECAYWTLETNKKAAWAYTDSLGFEGDEYLWNKWFDSERMKKQNDLVATSMIRKEVFQEVKGYELREKAVNEDWNFWLKLISKGYFPVRMNFYGFWYRRKKTGSELKRVKSNQERNMQIIQETAKKINKRVKAIQYPIQNYNWDIIKDEVETIVCPEFKQKNEKTNLLLIIPWLTTGGADKFNIDLIRGLDKSKFNITIITTEPQVNKYRQEAEKYATVYDLTTFIDRKYWISFINYIIKSHDINIILNTNSRFGYAILPYLKGKYSEIPIIDYIHMEEWYNRNGGYSRDSSGDMSVIDKTLVCNKNSEKILIENFGKNPKEVETIYIGVDSEQYKPTQDEDTKKEILEKYKIAKNNRFIISYICRISQQKRPHLLMQIIKMLKQQRNDFLFVIAGDGNMLEDIKKKTKKLGITENVVFVGNVKNTKHIYEISDLTINCSIKEGVALTAYESLSMGVPVITSDVGGQKELISENVGVVVPCMQKEEEIFDFDYSKEEIQNYVDAINKVLKDLPKYKSNCRQRILDGFTINNMVEKMTIILEEVKNNPNKEKIENGKGLSNNINITKEIITEFLEESNSEYEWLCLEYNKTYYKLTDDFKISKWTKVKERLWTHPTWRRFIKMLQKAGIIEKIKVMKK